MNVEIKFNVKDKPVRSVYFRLQIVDTNESILLTCNNEHTNHTYTILDKPGSVICNIPRLPLFGGTYYINLQIFSRETGLLDELEFAKELFVTDGDFFGTGKIPVIKKGLLVPHNWELLIH